VITVRVDDLAFYEGEAIARPVTAELGPTTTLLRRLEGAAGEALLRQLRLQEPLPVGSAIVTGAGALGVELLIHAVVRSDTEPVTPGSVRRAVQSALQRASDWQIARVAFPPFGLGAGNLDIEESAQIMIETMRRHEAVSSHPAEITVVVENDEERAAFEWCLARGQA
jgi:O-acetyl-ADP-ribose deacetylase (regulator of RNase III)